MNKLYMVVFCVASGLSFLAASLGTPQAVPAVEKPTPREYKAVLSLLVRGTDGTLAAEREIQIPFVPTAGIQVDLLDVEQVRWSTIRQAFILRCRTISHPTSKVRDTLRLYSGGAKWKEVFFSKK